MREYEAYTYRCTVSLTIKYAGGAVLPRHAVEPSGRNRLCVRNCTSTVQPMFTTQLPCISRVDQIATSSGQEIHSVTLRGSL